ncbi:MAG: carbohydrate kinase family protein [Vicinamibacteria bacterium]
MSKDLVVFGNLMVDDVVFPDGTTRMAEPGGAVIYAALGARLWGLDVGVVSIVGTDYPDWALEGMAAAGVDLAGVHPLGRPGVRIWLLYEDRLRQFVHRLERPAHPEVCPTSDTLPEAWRGARAFHVSPMPFATQKALVESLQALPDAFVSLDPLVPLRPETWDEWRGLAAKVDAFFVSEDEMRVGSDTGDYLKTLRRLAGGRLRYVAFKRSVRGGILYDAVADRVSQWDARAECVVDPTGAGDAFATGVLAGLLRGEDAARALHHGIVSTSFALEDWGPRAILAATREQAEARRAAWFPE